MLKTHRFAFHLVSFCSCVKVKNFCISGIKGTQVPTEDKFFWPKIAIYILKYARAYNFYSIFEHLKLIPHHSTKPFAINLVRLFCFNLKLYVVQTAHLAIQIQSAPNLTKSSAPA